MRENLLDITDIDNSFIQLAFYKTLKDTDEIAFSKSKETLEDIRKKISRGRSQYKSYLME